MKQPTAFDRTGNASDELQADINHFPFHDIYEAMSLAGELKYSFVATIKGHHGQPSQKWRVFPGDRSPEKIKSGRS